MLLPGCRQLALARSEDRFRGGQQLKQATVILRADPANQTLTPARGDGLSAVQGAHCCAHDSPYGVVIDGIVDRA